MFGLGDLAYDMGTGQAVRVVDCADNWGIRSYRVLDGSTGLVYRVPEARLLPAAEATEPDENWLRYVVEVARIRNEVSGGVLTPLAQDLIPLPHQLHALSRAMASNNVRYLLADEVGLGKTIEAGLILEELKARGLVRRTLVVCPTGLVTQWAAEMSEKFGEKFHVVLPSEFETIRELTDSDDVYGQFDQVISPMDAIKPIEGRIGWSDEKLKEYNRERMGAVMNGDWDLIIVDEAHRMAGSSSDVARHRLGVELSKASPYLLLLTATPHNGKSEPFLRLLRLLDHDAFPNERSVVRDQVAPYLIRTEKREAIDNEGNRLFKDRTTHLLQIGWDERHSMQRKLYERVSEYVSRTYGQAVRARKRNMCLIFLLIIMQRMVTSSTAAVRQSLERRLAVLEAHSARQRTMDESTLGDVDIEDGDEDAYEAIPLNEEAEIAELEELVSVAKQAELQYQDAKVDVLVDTLDAAKAGGKKAIVFTEFVATQEYLRRLLGKRGYTVSILNGSMGIDERNEAVAEFRDRSNVFISTDAGGEGLNLQFASVVVNYDMPWNPMKIEQRCGRVDRIGQKQDVQVYNLMIKDTVESRVHEVIEQKLGVILDELGIDKYSDVLDSESTDLDFTNAYMASIGKSAARIERVVAPIEKEMRAQVANAKDCRDLIHEEKDLGRLVGTESDFDVNEMLRRAMGHYAAWKGREAESAADDNLYQSEAAQRLLRSEIVQDKGAQLLSVEIEDFPNEAGYFMLWELSVADDQRSSRVIPVFVNKDMVLRPVAGRRIMDVLLDGRTGLHTHASSVVDDDTWDKLTAQAQEFCYNDFRELADEHERRSRENHDKYAYALKLREEAARRVGIENIRASKLAHIAAEREAMEADYRHAKQVLPEFRCMAMVMLEA